MPGVSLRLHTRRPDAQAAVGPSLGAQLVRRRRELGLTRTEAATELGVSWKTLMWWERNEREPFVSVYPAIIQFLGHEPWPDPVNLGETLLAFRRRKGLEIRKAATLIGVDEGTWRRWERGEWRPTRRMLPALDQLLRVSTANTYPADVRVPSVRSKLAGG